jgi:hypothetical protein
MDRDPAVESSAFVKGLGIAIGECVFGINGPFLFGRLGLDVPLAAVFGVLAGAGAGCAVAAIAWRVRRHAPARGRTARPFGNEAPHPA